MKIRVAEPARKEFLEAKEFYEVEQSGLGKRFADEIKRAGKRIKAYPEASPEVLPGIRQCTIHKFPYKIIYAVHQRDIIVLAFAHQHRRPAYRLWEDV